MPFLHCASFRLALDRPLVMGIVNLTADSFSGDGLDSDVARALAHAEVQRAAGADVLDLGAESTRPGAASVPAQEELARLLPVLRVVREWGLPISVDTLKPEVMRVVLDEGAALINDVAALTAPASLAALAASEAGVCLMHMQGEPRTMQHSPLYDDVVAEVAAFLAGRAAACVAAGIAPERILLDPGFGFGKTLEHNLALLRGLPQLAALGYPLVAGLSRKSMLGAITGRAVSERLPASIAAALLAVQNGAAMLRVHDVAATRDALAVLNSLENS